MYIYIFPFAYKSLNYCYMFNRTEIWNFSETNINKYIYYKTVSNKRYSFSLVIKHLRRIDIVWFN